MRRPFTALILLSAVAISFLSLSCDSYEPDYFIVNNLTCTPQVVESGEYVLIEFLMENKGDRGVLSAWTLEVDGEKVGEQEISAGEQDTTRGYFRITAGDAGNHTVTVYNTGQERLDGWFITVDPGEESSTD